MFTARHSTELGVGRKKVKKRKKAANAIKCVAAGAHLPAHWLYEPAKYADDTFDYCLGCSFFLVRTLGTSVVGIRIFETSSVWRVISADILHINPRKRKCNTHPPF